MLSEVLSITISEVKPTDIVDDLWFHHRDIEHRESFFSLIHDDLIDTSECLGVELLYIKWIDTTVFQELLQCLDCDKSLLVFVTWYSDDTGSVIDDELCSCCFLEEVDVSSFSSDEFSFAMFFGDIDTFDGILADGIGSDTRHDSHDHLHCFFVGFFFFDTTIFLDEGLDLFLFCLLDEIEKYFFCFFFAKSCDLCEFVLLDDDEFIYFFVSLVELLSLDLESFFFFVEFLFFLEDLLFELLESLLRLGDIFLRHFFDLESLLFSLEDDVFYFAVSSIGEFCLSETHLLEHIVFFATDSLEHLILCLFELIHLRFVRYCFVSECLLVTIEPGYSTDCQRGNDWEDCHQCHYILLLHKLKGFCIIDALSCLIVQWIEYCTERRSFIQA